MNGVLGKPYKFFYSARNFVSGLADIVAMVKRPDGTTKAMYGLTEVTDSIFEGTYIFTLPTTTNEQEGEYTVVIHEPTSGHRQISKVSLRIPTSGGGSVDLETDVTASLSTEVVTGKIESESALVGKLEENTVSAIIVGEEKIGATIISDEISAKISEEILIGKISECA